MTATPKQFQKVTKQFEETGPDVRDVKKWPPDQDGFYWVIVEGRPSALGTWLLHLEYSKEEGGFLQEDDGYVCKFYLTNDPILYPKQYASQQAGESQMALIKNIKQGLRDIDLAKDAERNKGIIEYCLRELAALDETPLPQPLTGGNESGMRKALEAILKEPHGCPFCDSGKLRTPNNPAKDHDPDCGFLLAKAALSNDQPKQDNPVDQHSEQDQDKLWQEVADELNDYFPPFYVEKLISKFIIKKK